MLQPLAWGAPHLRTWPPAVTSTDLTAVGLPIAPLACNQFIASGDATYCKWRQLAKAGFCTATRACLQVGARGQRGQRGPGGRGAEQGCRAERG